MRTPVDEEALRRLNERATALEERTARPEAPDYGGQAIGAAYRLLGELIGGLVVGLVVGLGVDAFAGTGPWGTVMGLFVGAAVGLFLALRSARRIGTAMQKEVGPPRALSATDEEEEDR
jgi:ATP synthase protein I